MTDNTAAIDTSVYNVLNKIDDVKQLLPDQNYIDLVQELQQLRRVCRAPPKPNVGWTGLVVVSWTLTIGTSQWSVEVPMETICTQATQPYGSIGEYMRNSNYDPMWLHLSMPISHTQPMHGTIYQHCCISAISGRSLGTPDPWCAFERVSPNGMHSVGFYRQFEGELWEGFSPDFDISPHVMLSLKMYDATNSSSSTFVLGKEEQELEQELETFVHRVNEFMETPGAMPTTLDTSAPWYERPSRRGSEVLVQWGTIQDMCATNFDFWACFPAHKELPHMRLAAMPSTLPRFVQMNNIHVGEWFIIVDS